MWIDSSPLNSPGDVQMSSKRWIRNHVVAASALVAAIGLNDRLAAQELTVGVTGSSSDAPFFVADKKGYFADEGLRVKLIRFDSAAKMIPSLGTGELDVASGATSAGLYNAAKRGVSIKIVADKARTAKGYGFQAVLVRKDLVDSGKVKSISDFKGLKVALSAMGNSESAVIDIALKKGGLSFADIDPIYLGFPEHTPAFLNKAIDASLTVEPTTSQILKMETAVKLIGSDDIYPDFQTAVTFYGANFIKNKPEEAKKFMKGLVRGMRYYNDALKDGKIAGPNSDDVVAILVEYSHIKDPAVHRAIISHAVDPDGYVNVEALKRAWEFFRDTKQIDGSVPVEAVLDQSFVKDAAAALGPYVKKTAP
jgi:NitT/TauT family transport system substrate-binding protein